MAEAKRKVEIAKYFILSSPSGEVNDVVKGELVSLSLSSATLCQKGGV